MLYAVYYRFFNKLNVFPTVDDLELIVDLPGLPSMSLKDLPTFSLPTSPFGTFPRLFSDLFQSLQKFKWVLGNSFDHLEKDIMDSMHDLCPIKPIGPLVPPALLGQDKELDGAIEMWKSDDSCIEWLVQQSPSSVIYVSFGSLVTLPAAQMGAIAHALPETKPFLWVVKPPEFLTPDGAGQLPPSFIEETKDQGKVVAWSPQSAAS
ncbi:hypothetical protein MLD38_026684 [Melastoma candidum]|uniref:Uncharacterized protein n=1 Tax=Melastoma candidum TaxID=119954 RepID=A0ACB9NZV8_9MYRT|nr:hypothetical protein MLD38_026684 [Melastoma candidum]